MQAVQEVFVVEEWVNDARNVAKADAHLHPKAEKALSAAKQKNQELVARLVEEEKGRRSFKVGLKNSKTQAEDQCKKLHYSEVERAIAQ